MATSKKHFGKFRGTVVNNVDPMQLGRLIVQVPDVPGLAPSSWARPCLPGKSDGSLVGSDPSPILAAR